MRDQMNMNTDRRSFLKGCGFVVAGMMGSGCAAVRTSKNAAKPNVIIIMTDDQGMGDIACMGNPYVETPNIDKLWADSVRLSDYHVCPTCSPTRAGFLTGKYNNRVGAWWTVRARELVYRLRCIVARVADGYEARVPVPLVRVEFGRGHGVAVGLVYVEYRLGFL